MHKMTTISLKMVEVVILNEKSCHFVSCSTWDKSCVKWDNSPKLTKMKRTEVNGGLIADFFFVVIFFCHPEITQPYCQKYAQRRSRCLAQWDAWECSYILFQNVFCLFSHIMSCNLSIQDYYSLPIWYF